MYEQFYGLTRSPFAVTPDPSLLYMSRAHREALATIIYGVETRKGFIVCSGEVGTGKTTVIRAFFDRVRNDLFKIIYLFTPQAGPLDMARYICRELDIAAPESVFTAVPAMQMKLLEIFEGGRTVVLMIDEAQLLPAETIEFLRLLSNFETDTEKLIQIVLVGQPEIDAVLARHDMRQVAQRIALRARLVPFGPDESLAYIEYRLLACGAAKPGDVLSLGAAQIIADAAGGIPRRINILADNVLICGFGADQRPVRRHLAAETVREFISNSGGEIPPFLAMPPVESAEPDTDWPYFVEPTPNAREPEPERSPKPMPAPDPAPAGPDHPSAAPAEGDPALRPIDPDGDAVADEAAAPEPDPEPELTVAGASFWDNATIVAAETPAAEVGQPPLVRLREIGLFGAAPDPSTVARDVPSRPHQRFRPRSRRQRPAGSAARH